MPSPQSDDLRPYRASIRRVMKQRKCSAEEAALRCAAVFGRKHIDDYVSRLMAALDQVKESKQC